MHSTHRLTVPAALLAVGVGTGMWIAGSGSVAGAASDVPSTIREPIALAASSRLASFHRPAGPIVPLPDAASLELDPRKVALGDRLFHDAGLSSDGTVACASCHSLDKAGADGRAVSLGVGGARGSRNAPTVLNSAFNFRQFWDGRARDLAEQVDGPLTNPDEMNSDWPTVLDRLATDDTYADDFRAIYGEDPSAAAVRDAIACFETSLVTPGSAFDRWLLGEADALSAQERRGWTLFQEVGCTTCHQGVNVGGNLFQRLGRVEPIERDADHAPDLGRFELTGRERDRGVFKVPSLRNVELTGPYLHDGSVSDLLQTVQIMARHQLGNELAMDEAEAITAFLRTLTGRQPARSETR